MVATWELRAAFARGLAAMYGREVPAYETLVEVTREVNAEVVGRDPEAAQRLGSVERVSAERHGAIRVGTPRELAQAARVFAAFGMHPVGFYDLRDAGPSTAAARLAGSGGGSGSVEGLRLTATSVPVVSTALRPIDAVELARNPFRVFTSMPVVDDPRYFDDDTRARLQAFLGGRVLFPAELLALADRAAAQGGLPPDVADELLSRATAAFALSSIPADRAWYDHLETISSVAADLGGVPTTHLNHLLGGTGRAAAPDVVPDARRGARVPVPRRIGAHGCAAGAVRGGGAARDRPDTPGGATSTTGWSPRPTPRGRPVRCGAGISRAPSAGRPNRRWRSSPTGSFFSYRVGGRPAPAGATLPELVDAGVLVPEPIVYEDFLPRSAAGIFRSNLAGEGTRDEGRTAPEYDLGRLAGVLGTTVHDPMDLYAAQQDASLQAAARTLGVLVRDDHLRSLTP